MSAAPINPSSSMNEQESLLSSSFWLFAYLLTAIEWTLLAIFLLAVAIVGPLMAVGYFMEKKKRTGYAKVAQEKSESEVAGTGKHGGTELVTEKN